jgi:hypothetical protein
MRREIPLKGGDEYDALTTAKKYYGFRAGTRKKIKARFNRRARKASKKLTAEYED